MTYRIMLLVELTRLSDMSDNLVSVILYVMCFCIRPHHTSFISCGAPPPTRGIVQCRR